MTVIQKQSKRYATGGIASSLRKRRQFENGRESYKPVVSATTKVKTIRVLGGNTKEKALSFEKANVYVPSEKKYKVVKINSVLENEANVNFVRRNILTKGTVIDTEAGKAKVTSRPGQEAVINAVLVE